MTVSKTDVEKAKQYEEEFRSLLDSSDFSYKPPQRARSGMRSFSRLTSGK